ncbi:hypothetical protein CYMTET_5256 [Cymbomonas tetramitiformis]|uniref:Uncharacterized protein n=1 Tax=Cymbomonas tetramitiformis TaxID=36881 RepID=A0AAE0LJN0_9CHLO|nr:hypothetical protein CYMTET_5256 [Cymbomonas tetramitiformis]
MLRRTLAQGVTLTARNFRTSAASHASTPAPTGPASWLYKPPQGFAKSPVVAAAEEAATTKATDSPLTPFLLPWERGIFSGERHEGPMTNMTKLYWVAFTGGIAVIVGVRIYDYQRDEKKRKEFEEDTELQAEIARKKQEAASWAMSGQSFIANRGKEDPFDGLTPEEIMALVEKEKDPYDGLSPEEIVAATEVERKKEALEGKRVFG